MGSRARWIFRTFITLLFVCLVAIPAPVFAAVPFVDGTSYYAITATGVTLSATLVDRGSASTVNVSFQYGTTTSYGSATSPQTKTSVPSSFNATLTGLTPNTTYHWRAKADGGAHGIYYTHDRTFTTSSPPFVDGTSYYAITSTGVTLTATLFELGTATTVNVSFQYGTTSSYGSATSPQPKTTVPNSFNATITGLTPNTTFHWRVKADGGVHGIYYTPDRTFTTSKTATPPSVSPLTLITIATPPTVTSIAATSVTTTSVTLNGNLTSLGSATTVNVFFEYGITTGYGSTTSTQPKTATGAFSASVTGLAPDTTFHYRARAASVSGSDMTFTTSQAPPTTTTAPTATTTTATTTSSTKAPSVGTNKATSVTSISATLNGNLTALGTATTVNVFFEYGTTTAYGSTTSAQAKTATGSFSASITGLAPDTTFHFRARAGDTTGVDMTFTTGSVPPLTGETDGGAKAGIPIYVWILVAALAVIALSAIIIAVKKRKAALVGSAAIESTLSPASFSTPIRPAPQPDYADTLKKLADLRNQGVITEEEFANKKKELLDKMTDSG